MVLFCSHEITTTNCYVDVLSELPYACNIINQSINQSKFYRANITGESRLSGATAKSVFNSKIEETVP